MLRGYLNSGGKVEDKVAVVVLPTAAVVVVVLQTTTTTTTKLIYLNLAKGKE